MPDDAHKTESSASQPEIGAITIAFGASPTDTALRVQTFSFDDFAALLSRPTVGEKAGSYYIRGGDLSYPERANANLLSADLVIIDGNSSFDPETGEITSGAPPMDGVCDVLARMGLAFVAHTTNSYIPGVLWKYRIAIPARMRSEAELPACVDCLIDRLHCEGVASMTSRRTRRGRNPGFCPALPTMKGVFISVPVELAWQAARCRTLSRLGRRTEGKAGP